MSGTVTVFLCSAVLTDLAGYWLHRMIHQRWSGPMYRAHMTHHLVLYPPGKMFSERYQSAGWDSLALWFSPFFVLLVGGYFLLGGPHPWVAAAGALASAMASSYAHDMTHIRGSFMWRWFGWTKDISVRHHTHHYKMRKNYGILVPWWDVMFRTRAGRSVAAFLAQRQSQRRARPGRPDDGP